MKKQIVAAMFTLVASSTLAMPEGWTDDFDVAKAQAAKEEKLLLVDFAGSDWCGWCMKLDAEVFSKKKFVKDAQKNFVLVMIDMPQNKEKLSEKARKQNPELLEKYKIRGFPTVLIMDAAGNVIAKTGYRDGGSKKYLKYINSIAENYKARAKQVKTEKPKAEQVSGK